MFNWRTWGPPKKFLVGGNSTRRLRTLPTFRWTILSKNWLQFDDLWRSQDMTHWDSLKMLLKTGNQKMWFPLLKLNLFHWKKLWIWLDSWATAHPMGRITSITLQSKSLLRHYINLFNMSSICHWKLGKLKPLLKFFDLDPMCPSSFLPICLLPTISKMMEKVVQVQLLWHLESTNQLHRYHHAYRERLNTTSALLHITDVIYCAMDYNSITSTMSMDMSTAFDCVSHELLLRKLPCYRIGQGTREWIKSYLNHRSIYVEVGDKTSVIRKSEVGKLSWATTVPPVC